MRLGKCESECLVVKHCQQPVSETRPSSAQAQPSFSVTPFWHWKWKVGENKAKKGFVPLCHINLPWRCSALTQPPISPYWTSLHTKPAEGQSRLGASSPYSSPPSYTPARKAAIMPDLTMAVLGRSTAQRTCLRAHCQALVGPVALERSGLWSDKLCRCKCNSYLSPNFFLVGLIHCSAVLNCRKDFLALKNSVQSCLFPCAAPPKKVCPGSIYFNVKRQLS